MTNETARMLLQTIADTSALTFDAQLKLTALEIALKEYEPNLLARYQKEVERLRQRPPYEVNLAGYGALQERLVRDQ
jgi:hypothetical protein